MERKSRVTFKKEKIIYFSFQNCIFTKTCVKKFRYPEPVKIGSTTLATGLNYLPDPLLAA